MQLSKNLSTIKKQLWITFLSLVTCYPQRLSIEISCYFKVLHKSTSPITFTTIFIYNIIKINNI